MSIIEDVKALQARALVLNGQLLSKREEYKKYLLDLSSLGIDPDDVPEAIEKANQDLLKIKESLTKEIKKVEEYLNG